MLKGKTNSLRAAVARDATRETTSTAGDHEDERARLAALAADLALYRDTPAIPPSVIAGAMRAIELAVVVLSGAAIQLLYVHPVEGFTWPYGAAMAFAGIACVVAFQAAGIYTVQALRSAVRQSARLAACWAGVFAVMALVAFFLKAGAEFSRVWLGLWFAVGLAALLACRMLAAALVRHWTRAGRLERRAVIVGGGERAATLIEALEGSPDTDVRICGVFDDRADDRSPPVVAGYPKLGTTGQLVDFARRTRVDLLIVSLPVTAERRLLEMLKTLWVLPVDIRLSAHTNQLRLRPRSYSYIGDVPLLDVFDRPITGWDHVVKSVFDRTLALAMLIGALPLLMAVALAVKLDSRGPVLFKQRRYGFNNELIEIYKFRSMRVEEADANASRLVTREDPRVTRVGRFIRRTSLDELPQLINVVKGELSLVGPRPHALHAKAAERLYDEVVDGYFARHRVKPGITGWAQINGWRGETDTPEKIQQRVEHDLYYIENWSVMFDLYILLMTPLALLNTRNAY